MIAEFSRTLECLRNNAHLKQLADVAMHLVRGVLAEDSKLEGRVNSPEAVGQRDCASDQGRAGRRLQHRRQRCACCRRPHSVAPGTEWAAPWARTQLCFDPRWYTALPMPLQVHTGLSKRYGPQKFTVIIAVAVALTL